MQAPSPDKNLHSLVAARARHALPPVERNPTGQSGRDHGWSVTYAQINAPILPNAVRCGVLAYRERRGDPDDGEI